MKFIKYTLISLLSLIIILAAGGYIFINNKLTPSLNLLQIDNGSEKLPIHWTKNESSEIAALLLEVSLRGVNLPLFMQFDLGAQNTIFYRKTLLDLEEHLPELNFDVDSTNYLKDFSFGLGNLNISAAKFETINYGETIDWQDSTQLNIIGTLGADLIEKKVVLLDFINDSISFGFQPDQHLEDSLMDFSFKYRMVLLPAMVEGRKRKLWYDTGTSGFDFITNESTWHKMAKPGAKPLNFDANSWGATLKTHTIASDKIIYFGDKTVALNSVTYVEGYSFLSEILARGTGMGGMIGNKIFMNKQVLIDGENQKFGIFNYDIESRRWQINIAI